MIIKVIVKRNTNNRESQTIEVQFDNEIIDQVQLIDFIKAVQTECESRQLLIPLGFKNFTINDLGKSILDLDFVDVMTISGEYQVKKDENTLSLTAISIKLPEIILDHLKENQDPDSTCALLNFCYKHELILLEQAKRLIAIIERRYRSSAIDGYCLEYDVYQRVKEIIAERKLTRRFGNLPNDVQHIAWEYIGISELNRIIKNNIKLNPRILGRFYDKILTKVRNLQVLPTDDEDLKKLANVRFEYKIEPKIADNHLLTTAESGDVFLFKLALEYKANVNFTKREAPTYNLYLIPQFDQSFLANDYKFNFRNAENVKGNAVILSDQNTACFMIEDKIVMKNEHPLVVEVNRQQIPFCQHNNAIFLYTDSELKKKNVIKEAIEKRGSAADNDYTYVEYETALMHAIRKGNIAIIEILLQSPGVKHTTTLRGHSSLGHAIYYKQKEVLEMLTKRKYPNIDIHECDSNKQPLLFQVIELGYFDVVGNLLSRGVSANLTGPGDLTALMKAAQHNQVQIAKKLLENKADIDQIDCSGETALMKAVRACQLEAVNLLLEREAKIDEGNNNGETALLIATLIATPDSDSKIIATLLQHGAHVNATDLKRNTALINVFRSSASIALKFEIVKLLRAAGATIFNLNLKGENALSVAKNDSPDLCQAIKNPAYISRDTRVQPAPRRPSPQSERKLENKQPSIGGLSTLMKAVQRQVLKNPAYIFSNTRVQPEPRLPLPQPERKLEYKQSSIGDLTALMKAVQDNQVKIAEGLLENKADINQIDRSGETALMKAVHAYQLEAVNLLLKYEAKIEERNNNWQTALLIVTQYPDRNIIATLLQHGAHVNAIDLEHNTALINVCRSFVPIELKIEIVKILIAAGATIFHLNLKGENALNVAPELCQVLKTPAYIFRDTLFQPAPRSPSPQPERKLEYKQPSIQASAFRASSRASVETKSVYLSNRINWISKLKKIDKRLLEAAKNGDIKDLQSALKEGANVNCSTSIDEVTPLMMAIQKGHVAIVEELLRVPKLDSFARNSENCTALMIAIESKAETGRKEIIEMLIKYGSDNLINAACDEGNTPLILAIKNGDLDIAKLLLERGVDPSPANKRGETAISLAKRICQETDNNYGLLTLLHESLKKQKNNQVSDENNSISTSSSFNSPPGGGGMW